MDERGSLSHAVSALLHRMAQALVMPDEELGCMLNIGMIASHPDHVSLAREVADRRASFRQLLSEKLRRWMSAVQAEVLARYLVSVQGLTIQARDGASLSQLESTFAFVLHGIELQAEAGHHAQRPTKNKKKLPVGPIPPQ